MLAHAQVVEATDQLAQALTYLTPQTTQEIIAAAQYADAAHTGIVRKSGEPYILHPIAVADVLAKMHLDADSLKAALLHDVIEDTAITKEQIADLFSPKVAELVDGVTKLELSTDKHTNKAASFRKMIQATLRDPRVMVIKLADRLHNMSTLAALRPDKRIRIAQETQDFFVPMARIMALNELGDQLENLCIQQLEPELYAKVNQALADTAVWRLPLAQQRINDLQQLIDQHKLQAYIEHLETEHLIYRLLRKDHTDLHALLGQQHLDVILPTIADCLTLAKVLEQAYPNHHVNDYIHVPLAGGHQSYQLDLYDTKGLFFVRLMTPRMQAALQRGVLLGQQAPEATRSAIQASLRNLGDLIDADCAKSTFNALLDYLHRDKMLVYTPAGDVHELPMGATAIDFAYAVSTFIGQHAIGAKIDGVIRTLTTPLKSGQTVYILTDIQSMPNPEWLSAVVTNRARRSIQSVIRDLTVEEQIQLGADALNRALRQHQRSLQQLTAADWDDLLKWQHVSQQSLLFIQIATGHLLPQFVAMRVLGNQVLNPATSSSSPVDLTKYRSLIQGTQGIDIRYAQCCGPILGDTIFGHLTRKCLVVHRQRCANIQYEMLNHPQHIVRLHWDKTSLDDPRFPVHLCIERALPAEHISLLIDCINDAKAALESLRPDPEQRATHINVLVRDRDHLAKLMRDIRYQLHFPKISRLAPEQAV